MDTQCTLSALIYSGKDFLMQPQIFPLEGIQNALNLLIVVFV